MIIDSRAEDIVYTSLFTGVHGNYLKGSVVNAGLDPDNLPEGDKSKMDFGSAAPRPRHGAISGARGRASGRFERAAARGSNCRATGSRVRTRPSTTGRKLTAARKVTPTPGRTAHSVANAGLRYCTFTPSRSSRVCGASICAPTANTRDLRFGRA